MTNPTSTFAVSEGSTVADLTASIKKTDPRAIEAIAVDGQPLAEDDKLEGLAGKVVSVTFEDKSAAQIQLE
ncbi:hypothetical protein H4R18_004491 [Coemansia javaensis]|uniref:Uncharacterized protein n=1 Tax=Coemansia javaensis TaxID=2761396 RepID=A0A9W8H5Z3_9FUNG|nr:hypothetical protein H4R18_004491 [Coemansia javaensis]